jgi:hypothetical protein
MSERLSSHQCAQETRRRRKLRIHPGAYSDEENSDIWSHSGQRIQSRISDDLVLRTTSARAVRSGRGRLGCSEA